MTKPKKWLFLWIATLLVATVIDFWVRTASDFDMGVVTRVEGILFPATGLVMYLLYRSRPESSRRWRVTQVFLIAAFVLAGLRSAIWGFASSVFWANTVTLALTVTLIGWWLVTRRNTTTA